MRALSVGATGMMAQQLHVEVISNNIANMTTTGYKKRRPEFQDMLYQNQRRTGSETSDAGTILPAGVQLGLGVKTAAVYRIHEQGTMVATENNLDIAIEGDGFFIVDLPSGEQAYTRSGNFQLSGDGQIVTQDGYPVAPGLTIPPDTIQLSINATGEVSAKLQGQINLTNVGTLDMANFLNPAGLEAIGSNYLVETEASGAAAIGTPGDGSIGTVLQGYLEGSNVNAVQEITALITAQRAYDMNSKVISAADEMMSTVNQLR